MRCTLLVILIVMHCFIVNAQNDRIDSLLYSLSKSTPSTYHQVFKHLETEFAESSNPSINLKKVNKTHIISRELYFKGPRSGAYRCEAIIYLKNNDLRKAFVAAQKALTLAKQFHLPLEQAKSLIVLGNIYKLDQRDDLALHHYLYALKTYTKLGKEKEEAPILFYYIGDIYFGIHNYSLAEEYLLKAYAFGKESLSRRVLTSTLNTLALVYRTKKDFTKAINFQLLSIQVAQANKDSAWVGITSGNLGRIYQLQGKNDLAIKFYKIDLSLSQRFKVWGDAIVTLSRIGEIYTHKKEYTSAKAIFDKALILAEREKEYDDLVILYASLSEYYTKIKFFEKALHYQTLLYQVKDSLEKRNYNSEIYKIKSAFDFEKKQTEIELLKKNNEIIKASEQRKDSGLLWMVSLLFCIIIFTLLLYRSHNQKHNANLLLTQKQKELGEINEEVNRQNQEITELNNSLEEMVQQRTSQLQIALDNLVKQNQNLEQFGYVVSHNLRGPIAQIMGLVDIFNKANINDPVNLNVLEFLTKASKNLDKIVNDLNDILLMRNLLNDNKETVNLEDVITSAIESLEEAIEISKANIKTDFSQVSVLTTLRSYINSILYNLISNAIKYRSPDRTPEILIQTSIVNNSVCIMVQDNGLGLDFTKINPQKLFKLYQRMHFHTEGKGMGLFIVKEQIEALNGKIEVESQPNEGTTFKVYLPLQS